VWIVLVLIAAGTAAAAVLTGVVMALPLLGAALLVVAGAFELLVLPRARRKKAERLGETFERIYDRELLMRDRSEDLRTLWEQVHQRTREVAARRGLHSFGKLRRQDRDRLNRLIEVEIPQLRSELYEKLNKQAAKPVPAE
jgi:biopolymer transport protein ExbB/TolQ